MGAEPHKQTEKVVDERWNTGRETKNDERSGELEIVEDENGKLRIQRSAGLCNFMQECSFQRLKQVSF